MTDFGFSPLKTLQKNNKNISRYIEDKEETFNNYTNNTNCSKYVRIYWKNSKLVHKFQSSKNKDICNIKIKVLIISNQKNK